MIYMLYFLLLAPPSTQQQATSSSQAGSSTPPRLHTLHPIIKIDPALYTVGFTSSAKIQR